MKVTIEIDCTPQEARQFLGLPDVAPMQEAMLKQIQERMGSALHSTDPESLFRLWLPFGLPGLDEAVKRFQGQIAATLNSGAAKAGNTKAGSGA